MRAKLLARGLMVGAVAGLWYSARAPAPLVDRTSDSQVDAIRLDTLLKGLHFDDNPFSW